MNTRTTDSKSSSKQHNQSQISNEIIYPNEQSVHHQQHIPLYGCSHVHEQRSQQRTASFQPNSVTDYPYLLLPSQRIRDLTDVYRREKNFLQEKHQSKILCSDEIFQNNTGESPIADVPDQLVSYRVPCNCETSLPRKIFQNFFNSVKYSLEFFLFIGYVIRRRDELLNSYYPFDKHQTYNSQTNNNYPFVRHSIDSIELNHVNAIRKQVNQKKSPTKYTTKETCYIIH